MSNYERRGLDRLLDAINSPSLPPRVAGAQVQPATFLKFKTHGPQYPLMTVRPALTPPDGLLEDPERWDGMS